MYQRFYRADDNKGPSVVDMNYDQYIDWLDPATKARDRYLAGELTAEEAMTMISVPTKDELLERISSELTPPQCRVNITNTFEVMVVKEYIDALRKQIADNPPKLDVGKSVLDFFYEAYS